jgi:ATP/maltotriose-dependent transcriptional regulator MalT
LRVLWLFLAQWDHIGLVREWVEQLASIADELDPRSQAELFWTRMVVADSFGDRAVVLASRARLKPLVDQLDDEFLRALCGGGLAWTAPIVDDLDVALPAAKASVEQLRRQHEPFWTGIALAAAGNMEITIGRHDDAARDLGEALEWARRLDNPWLVGWSQTELGILAATRGRVPEARGLLDDGLTQSLNAHDTSRVSVCVYGFARLALAQGNAERAALLAGAADGMEPFGLGAWAIQTKRNAILRDEIRAALGDDAFDRAYAAGTRLSQRETLALVRG